MSRATPSLSHMPSWCSLDTEQAGLEVTVSTSDQLPGSNLAQNPDYSLLLRNLSKHFKSNSVLVQ